MADSTLLSAAARDAASPPPGSPVAALPDYVVDAVQRGILFLDLLRQRGNEEIRDASRPMATVLRFDYETLLDGASLPRPINYLLLRIVPPVGAPATDPRKRPVVVIDPRAGQGPGIGGFKAQSEIGDALQAGHPVYFIGFAARPLPGQDFLDVVEGQVRFFEEVVARHPDAPPPFAIGNCQAGYQTLMVAMLRPDLFGPCLVVGSPMSYWQGVHGKNPMRYSGGLLGGSWLTALTSDLGHGMFDGTWLVLNFDILGPANWLWGKQYQVYSDVDGSGQRYLSFEKWWGDFIQLNGGELQYLVDNLFIGDKLARNQLRAHDGTIFDIRNITSPIIVFTSAGDNISPPPQALGWVLDLYQSVEEIRAAGQTIVYCLGDHIGHLALFVSSKVGAKEDAEFIQLMNVIDCLPPGLHEMVITHRPADAPADTMGTGEWITRFECRDLDDIRALGRNSAADDRAFATVARLSDLNLSLYRAVMQPMMRLLGSQPLADLGRALNPLRLSYTLFADRNPWMSGVGKLATAVSAARMSVRADNPFLVAQTRISDQITTALDTYQHSRDQISERIFFGIYGSPAVQYVLGITADTPIRTSPETSPVMMAARQARINACAAKLHVGGFNAALTRAVIYVISAEQAFDERCALAFNVIRQTLMQMSLSDFKALALDQFTVLQLAPERALDTIATMVPGEEERQTLLQQVHAIVGAGGPPSALECARLVRLSELLTAPAAAIPLRA